MKKVTLAEVLAWIGQALEAARRDPGDGEGGTTAISYRELRVTFVAEPGESYVYVRTRNWEFSGSGEKTYRAVTDDGVEVRWYAEDIGIPTGADWLPGEFIAWMRAGR